jgi:hypothetical protein
VVVQQRHMAHLLRNAVHKVGRAHVVQPGDHANVGQKKKTKKQKHKKQKNK